MMRQTERLALWGSDRHILNFSTEGEFNNGNIQAAKVLGEIENKKTNW